MRYEDTSGPIMCARRTGYNETPRKLLPALNPQSERRTHERAEKAHRSHGAQCRPHPARRVQK